MKPLLTEDAILDVYHETLDTLYGYVSRRTDGDRALAEDVVQETWLRAVAVWPHQGLPRKPIAWLSTVARNVLLNKRRTALTMSLEALMSTAGEQIYDPRNAECESRTVIRHALARLPRSRARLLERFHLEGFSVTEIAESEGLSARAVEGRLRRARQVLKQELEALRSEGETS